ncbi:hypothetical protein GMOD_00002433 [Pyrenophora seminiperda CCB06]|uniref:Uncharacterized protein n=1 Tax=Pyrenophora seminiperda CCB06 TaxID=1302712 RepID=A0A3M7LXW2_9PLEO|nr:hypothetical protein GMOD_00002433 [Pyrenophora seminiperda CCB06]
MVGAFLQELAIYLSYKGGKSARNR